MADDPKSLFVFPFSPSMNAFLFGNFEDHLAFDLISDDEVIEVLNEVNQAITEPEKSSLDLNNLKAEAAENRSKSTFKNTSHTLPESKISNTPRGTSTPMTPLQYTDSESSHSSNLMF